MKIIIIGRTINLLNSARELQNLGHSIVGVITSKSSAEDKVNENHFSQFATEMGIPFLSKPKIDISLIKDVFKGVRAEIAISINYTSIIPQNVIEFFL